MSKGFISALEVGRSVPNLDMLVQLAEALGVPAGTLVDAIVEEAARFVRDAGRSSAPRRKK